MKTLYFEAAGCYILHNDVESGRIRTAFTNRDGKKVYIELICGYGYMFCDSCHYITDDPKINDCMESRLPCERNLYIKKVRYTKENILNFVNTYCNADFEEVVVLHNLAGYRVFSDCQKKGTSAAYRYGDEFPYDAELTLKRQKRLNVCHCLPFAGWICMIPYMCFLTKHMRSILCLRMKPSKKICLTFAKLRESHDSMMQSKSAERLR